MSCQHIFKAGILTTHVLFAAALAVLVDSAVSAQQANAAQPSAQVSAVSAALKNDTSAPPPHALTGTSNVEHSHMAQVRTKNAASTPMDSGNPLFLPGVLYDSGGANPSSVAVADVNGDGKPDVIVANSFGRSVGVLLGNGDGTFQTAVTYPCPQPNFVAVADVNGDGKPDVIVATWGVVGTSDGLVGVLMGNGDGTFQPVVLYDSGGIDASSLAVADVNGDGKPDIVVTNSFCRGNDSCLTGSVGVLLGNGDGTFQPSVTYGSGGYGGANSVAIADLNGDGKLDLVVANSWNCPGASCGPTTGTVGILLGNGDGTFQPAVAYSSGGILASSVAVADLNRDGKPDLLVSTLYYEGGANGGTVGVLLGNGDGTFQPVETYSSGGWYASSIAAADVNADGNPDAVVANQCDDTDYGPCEGIVGVLLGDAGGTFQPALTYNGGSPGLVSVAVADVNGDGRPDLVVAGGTGAIGVLLNDTGPHTPTTTALASSADPAMLNQVVTYAATVVGQSGETMAGNVTFYDAGTELTAVKPVNGQATYSTSYRERGIHSISASYSGDLHNSPSTSATLTQEIAVVRVPTTLALSTSESPSLVGQPLTLSARVSWQYGTAPDGEPVTFYEGSRALGSIALAGGLASYTTSSLASGTHTIKATYSGDASFRPSLARVAEVINRYATSTTLVSSLNPSIYGQSVTWTVNVTTSGSVTPSGIVSLTWGDSIGTATLNASGVATITTSRLNAGSCPLTAVYLGDGNNGGSTSPVLNQLVTRTTSTATLTSSPNPSVGNQAVTFKARITSPTVTATGPVTFMAGKRVLGTAQLNNGEAEFTISTPPVGSTAVTGTYYGDSDIAGSSASVKQHVQ